MIIYEPIITVVSNFITPKTPQMKRNVSFLLLGSFGIFTLLLPSCTPQIKLDEAERKLAITRDSIKTLQDEVAYLTSQTDSQEPSLQPIKANETWNKRLKKNHLLVLFEDSLIKNNDTLTSLVNQQEAILNRYWEMQGTKLEKILNNRPDGKALMLSMAKQVIFDTQEDTFVSDLRALPEIRVLAERQDPEVVNVNNKIDAIHESIRKAALKKDADLTKEFALTKE